MARPNGWPPLYSRAFLFPLIKQLVSVQHWIIMTRIYLPPTFQHEVACKVPHFLLKRTCGRSPGHGSGSSTLCGLSFVGDSPDNPLRYLSHRLLCSPSSHINYSEIVEDHLARQLAG